MLPRCRRLPSLVTACAATLSLPAAAAAAVVCRARPLAMGATFSSDPSGGDSGDPRAVSEQEWRQRLTPLQFQVTRRSGTEPAWTGRLPAAPPGGSYSCVCCGAPLFRPETKFESGSGWPSFHSAESTVQQRVDTSHGMVRREVLCGRCSAHLGHVFDDGPAPTGLRYCINAAALSASTQPPGSD